MTLCIVRLRLARTSVRCGATADSADTDDERPSPSIREQAGQGDQPRCDCSFAAAASCVAGDAWFAVPE